ncbi:MAG: hypothetical protein RJQ07_01420 [Pseudomonadales bacterium]
MAKSAQLQIRVTPEQKQRIKEKAYRTGEDVSQWVLSRLLPDCADELQSMVDVLASNPKTRRYTLAELHDYFVSEDSNQLGQAFELLDCSALEPLESNYVAAMIETACTNRNIAPPSWLSSIAPLTDPWFATRLRSLKVYLLTASPPAFRRRNLFVDSTLGARV